MNWDALNIDASMAEILDAVRDDGWQFVRLCMKGESLEKKYEILTTYLTRYDNEIELRRKQVRVSNYVNALRRAGHLPKRRNNV